MNLQDKLTEFESMYKQIVERVQKIETEKAQLINEGVKLEGKITLLREQLAEGAKSNEPLSPVVNQ